MLGARLGDHQNNMLIRVCDANPAVDSAAAVKKAFSAAMSEDYDGASVSVRRTVCDALGTQ
jgi:hypothetical protein